MEFDGWATTTDVANLMQLRQEKRIILFKADILGKYYSNPMFFVYVEDIILNEQRGFIGDYPYKIRLRQVADFDNYNRTTAFTYTQEYTTFNMTPKPVVTYPILDGALSFNGSSQYCLLSSPSSVLNLSGSATFEVWVKPTALSGAQTLISKGNSGGTQFNFNVAINNSGNVVFTYTSGGGAVTHTWTTTTQPLTAGVWNSVFVTFTFGTGSSIAVYVNGGTPLGLGNAAAATGSWTSGTGNAAPDTVSQRLVLAANSALTSLFGGALSNCGIRTALLTGVDAQASFYRQTPLLATLSSTGTPTIVSVGYWKLNEWFGTTNYDSSQNGNTLTMMGGPSFTAGQSNITPTQTPTSVLNAEFGGLPYVSNPLNNHVNYHSVDYDLDFNNVVCGQTSAGELWMKNGVIKIQSRTTQPNNVGAMDLWYWNGTTYAYAGFFYHELYASQWENTSNQTCTPQFILSDDTEYGSMKVTWNGFTDGVTLEAEYALYKGKRYVNALLVNVGLPTLNAYGTLFSNHAGSSLVNWNQNGLTMTPGGAGVPQSLISQAGITQDAAATGNTGSAAAASMSATLTNAANVLIVAAVGIRNSSSQTVSSIVYDSAGLNMAFTKVNTVVNGTNQDLEYWYLWQPNAGTSKTITCTFSASAEASMVVVSLIGTNAALNNALTTIGTSAASTLTLVANEPVATQITLPLPQNVTQIGINWNTIVAGNVIAALYSDNGSNAPGTLLTQSATTAQGSAGWQDIAVPSYFAAAGKYWVAINSSSASKINLLASSGLENIYNAALGSLTFDNSWGSSGGTTGSANTLEVRVWQTSALNLIFETAAANNPTQTSSSGTAVSVTVAPYDHQAGRWILMATAATGTAAGAPSVTPGSSQTDIGTTMGTDATYANDCRIDLNRQASDISTTLTATLSAATSFTCMAIPVIPQTMVNAQSDANAYDYASSGALGVGATEIYVTARTKGNDRYYTAPPSWFNDSAYPPNPITPVNGPIIDFTQSPPFGTGAGKFVAASTEYLTIPNSADWSFGSGDFTIDFWVKFNSLPANGSWMTFWDNVQDANNYAVFYFYNSAGNYYLGAVIASGGTGIFGVNSPMSPTPTTGTWYHVAYSRSGNSMHFFWAGTNISNSAFTSAYPSTTGSAIIGYDASGNTGYLDGWLKEFRVSKGVARWTSNFTPPTAEYTPDQYTALLLHMNGAWGTIGQRFGTATSTVATSNDMERFWIGARLMQSGAGGDDDPAQLQTEMFATVDQTQDVTKAT